MGDSSGARISVRECPHESGQKLFVADMSCDLSSAAGLLKVSILRTAGWEQEEGLPVTLYCRGITLDDSRTLAEQGVKSGSKIVVIRRRPPPKEIVNTREGTSAYVYPRGLFRYEGEWVEKKKHGQGTLLVDGFPVYTGEFQHGEIVGHGIKRWPDGSSYSGQFYLGHMHGQGAYAGADGESYEGEHRANQRHGYGVLTTAAGERYEGTFLRHRAHGEGTWTGAGGESYAGQWYSGRRQGRGLAKWPSGDVYDGEWYEDARQGLGTLIDVASGITYVGEWRDDAPADLPAALQFDFPPPPAPPEGAPEAAAPVPPTPRTAARNKAAAAAAAAKPPAPPPVAGAAAGAKKGGPAEAAPGEEAEAGPRALEVEGLALPPLRVVCVREDGSPSTSESNRILQLSVSLDAEAVEAAKPGKPAAAAKGAAKGGAKGGAPPPPPPKAAPAADAGPPQPTPVPFAGPKYPPLWAAVARTSQGAAVFEGLALDAAAARAGSYTLRVEDVTPSAARLKPAAHPLKLLLPP